MTQKAPGKAYRKGLTFLEVADMLRDEESARRWIEEQRWPTGVRHHRPDGCRCRGHAGETAHL